MCGRFRQTRSQKQLEEAFDGRFDMLPEELTFENLKIAPHYNIAASQNIVIVRQERSQPARRLSFMRWGLVPHWAKELKAGYKNINARAETAATTPAFRDAFKSQRCLIPADGFYEWQKNGTTKQPYIFEIAKDEPFAFAGLWDKWRQPGESVIESCTILTTRPNELVSGIHDRMPVILNPGDYDLWLDPAFRNAEDLTAMLQPFPATRMRRHAVSARVNDPKNDDPECAKPFEPRPTASQARLF
jgi:putative SOS response-associated peptidase YedK